MKRIATNIKTELWNEIIHSLRKNGWIVTAKYYGFDAGIDNDYLVLRKGLQKVEFAWTNWFEGEIKADKDFLTKLEKEHKVIFDFGESHSLKNVVRLTFRLQSLPLWILNKLKHFRKKL